MDERMKSILLRHGVNVFIGFKELTMQSNGGLLINICVPRIQLSDVLVSPT
jgi:hypothetical protein